MSLFHASIQTLRRGSCPYPGLVPASDFLFVGYDNLFHELESSQILLMEDGKLLHYGPPAEVFVDHGLVSKARMKLPAVMEIYQELRGRGILDGDRPPRNILELTNLLERAKVVFPKVCPGKIYLYDVDHA